LTPVLLEVLTEARGSLVKTVSTNWSFGDIRESLCQSLRVPFSSYGFVQWESGEAIDDSSSVGSFTEHHSPRIKLQAVRTPFGGKDSAHSQKVLRKLAAPTFSESSFPRGLDPSRKAASTFDIRFPKLVGLVNLENDCYLNATLQCLIRIPLLADMVLSPDFPGRVNIHNPLGTGGAIAREFAQFLRDMCAPNSTGLSDNCAFKSALCSAYSAFADGGQHDAHEALSVILDRLHEDLSRLHYDDGGLTPRSKSLQTEEPIKPLSPIADLFYGQLVCQLSCPNCGHKHENLERFSNLSLPVPQNNSDPASLVDLLRLILKRDKLDQDNLWTCPECQNKVKASRETAIQKAPPILVIHLKRFQANRGIPKKVCTRIDFPAAFDMGGLSMRTSGHYKLLGVVMHAGAISSGHYTAAAIDPMSGKWFQFNDTNVSPASDQIVHSARAYMLFYQKID
jgi:ubiquitin carboxyl-terminal hydrolase 8